MRFLALIFIMLITQSADAFSPEIHVGFSEDAAALYQCHTKNTVPARAIEALAKGSEAEDFPLPSRGLNWHFYNNNGKIGTYWKFFLIPCNGSNQKIFQKRVDRLHELILDQAPIEKIYAAAGRVAHHIQDMSSPPHVMPIYHTSKDLFDKYEPKTTFHPLTDIDRDLLGGEIISPCRLLEEAAQRTIEVVGKPVVFSSGQGMQDETWQKFWGGVPDTKYPGFLEYGDYKNDDQNGFGNVLVLSGAAVRGRYDSEVFDTFFNGRRQRAIIDTVKLLLYVDSIMTTVECRR